MNKTNISNINNTQMNNTHMNMNYTNMNNAQMNLNANNTHSLMNNTNMTFQSNSNRTNPNLIRNTLLKMNKMKKTNELGLAKKDKFMDSFTGDNENDDDLVSEANPIVNKINMEEDI